MRVEGQARAGRPNISALLTAPAGSGKTRSLVGRIVTLLSFGARPSDIAAITFTEKAAAEMKERLFRTLSDPALCKSTAKEVFELSPEDLAGQPAAGPALTLEEIFGSLVREPGSLKIGTIHSFLLDLLRSYPLEAGLPADFEILPETGLLLRRDEAVEEVLRLLEGGARSDECDMLYRAGYDIRKLRALIALSLEKRGLIAHARKGFGGLGQNAEKVASMLREAINSGSAQALARQALRLIPEMLDGEIKESLSALSKLREPDDLPEIFEAVKGFFYTDKGSPLVNIPPAKKGFKEVYGKTEWTARRAKWVETYTALRESFSEPARLYDSTVSAGAVSAFLSLARLSGEVYRKMCLRDGFIDFEDIEIYALKLLDSRPDIRLPRHLLVDEFQDTSRMQWGLLTKIAGEQFSGEGAEGLNSPTFFAVGDVNQSIYRFRKAETRLTKDLRALMEERIAPQKRDFPELDINFRSAPEIIEFTDQTFMPLLGGDYRGGRAARDFGGSVRLRLAEDEPRALAEEVIKALRLDVEVDGKVRKARLGDMAVLVQSRSRLKDYERALRRCGIPFRVLGGTGFFRQDEVRAVLAVLKYLENPSDTFSLRRALASPFFGIPEGSIPPFAGKDPIAWLAESGQADAAGLFVNWREAAGNVPFPELVDCITNFARSRSAGQAVFNIERLSRLARDFGQYTGSAGGGLHDFMEWVRDYRKGGDLPSEDMRKGGDEGANYLTILTIHSAKGLEFPVVFLPGMGAYTRSDNGSVLFGQPGDDIPLAMRTESLFEENGDYQALKELEAVERAKEKARLFYVAVTRARDHLIMLSGSRATSFGQGRSFRPESFAGMLLYASPECLFGQGFSADVTEYDYPEARFSGTSPDYLDSFTPAVEGGETRHKMPPPERVAPLPDCPGVGSLATGRFISPSSLADSALLKDAGRSEGSAAVGSLVHEALESYGKTGGYNIRTLPSFGRSSGDEAAEADKILANLLSLPHVKEIFSAPGYYELPLLLRDGDDIIYGFADLVIVENGMARVIDFKTGMADVPEDICVRAYRPQLEAYAKAVRAVFGVGEPEKYLLIAETGKLLPV